MHTINNLAHFKNIQICTPFCLFSVWKFQTFWVSLRLPAAQWESVADLKGVGGDEWAVSTARVLPWTPVRSFRARRYELERDDSPLTLLISISITIAFLLYSSSSSGLTVFSFPYAVSVHWACSVCSARSIHRFKLSLYPFPNRMKRGLFALTSLFFARQNYISAIQVNSDRHGLHFFVLK